VKCGIKVTCRAPNPPFGAESLPAETAGRAIPIIACSACFFLLALNTLATTWAEEAKLVMESSEAVLLLRNRLQQATTTGAKVLPGERITLSVLEDRSLDEDYVISETGTITLTGGISIEAVGHDALSLEKAVEEVLARKHKSKVTVLVQQTWRQRPNRLLPGESALIQWRLGKLALLALEPQQASVNVGQETGMPYVEFDWRRSFHHRLSARSNHEREEARRAVSSAKSHFEKAVADDANLAPAYLGLGWCWEAEGQTERAISVYREGLECAWRRESRAERLRTSTFLEISERLLGLLDPQKDAAVIGDIQTKRKLTERKLPLSSRP
jgi:tetratricopeptide (TPR) repeat protein